ncbi:hypothetical protein F0L68_29300 [Solihabitans fulvus]|uniref:Uncharacterized protein n=1 Tax=Solihabitans fulvus TaxID=1892852 RepID=A0A5B2WVJ3_9PSEU|nr:hypothetical protein [Solihabitans fulvus]KAA2254880.1 hypothetical protein F0L68_29300 [Solihabitans fulvus]
MALSRSNLLAKTVAISLAVGGLLAGLTPPAGAADDGPAFEVVASPALPQGSALNAIATEGGRTAWAVGQAPTGDPNSGNRSPVVERWDGGKWQLVTLPALPDIAGHPIISAELNSVSVSRDGEVWAAGEQRPANRHWRPLVLHEVAGTWSVLPIPTDLALVPSYVLLSVTAVDAKHVWAAGYSVFHHGQIFLMSWDGTQWNDSYVLPLPGGFFGNLASLLARSEHDVWATGVAAFGPGGPIRSEVATYHWDGTAWSPVAMPTVPGLPNGVLGSGDSLAAGRDDLWLAGSTISDPAISSTIERWNGSAWTVGPALPAQPVPLTVSQVAADRHDHAWAVGTYPDSTGPATRSVADIVRWDGQRWQRAELPASVSSADTTAITVAITRGGHTTWAIVNTSAGPTILRAAAHDSASDGD